MASPTGSGSGPSPPPPGGGTHAPGAAWLVTWVVAIAVLLAIAGVAAWGISTSTTAPPPAPPPGWLTFHQAAVIAQQVSDSLVVGPWSLAFATGVAADGPWAPTIGGTFSATPPCAGRLSGISLFTYWNDSYYPAAHGPTVFTTGATPLWSFGYRDSSGDTAIISVVNGTGVYNGLWTAGSGCATPLDRSYLTGFSPASVADSSQVAARIQGTPSGFLAPAAGSGAAFDPSAPGTAFEMYSLGNAISGTNGIDPNLITTEHLPSWWNVWGRCGLQGDHGLSPSVVVQLNATTASIEGNGLNSPLDCQSVGAAGSIASPSVGVPSGPAGMFESWNLRLTESTSIVPPPSGWNVVTTGEITPVLDTNGTTGLPFTTTVPSGEALCGVGTGSLTDCEVNPSGWYAVLSDSHGNWLDSFPSAAGGSNWTRTDVPVSSGDSIEILVPLEAPAVKLFVLAFEGWDGNVGAAYVDL